MIRRYWVLVSVWCLWAGCAWALPPWVVGVMSSSVSPSGPTCAGDFLAGANESFEQGTDQFCVSGLARYGGDTYSTAAAVCGTHGYRTSGASGDYVISTFTVDSDFRTRFGYIPADLPDYTSTPGAIFSASGGGSWDYHQAFIVGHLDPGGAGTQDQLKLCTQFGACSDEYYTITPGEKYAIDIHAVCSTGTSSLRMYRQEADGSWTSMTSNTSGPSISIITQNYACGAVMYGSSRSTSVERFDDIQIALSATDYIGPPTCD